MSSTETSAELMSERHDDTVETAFYLATDGAITLPNTLQQALYPRLMTQDTGLLVQTGPCAGRLEAVFVPAMTANRSDVNLQRLFIISADGSFLDDYLYRLAPYVRAMAVNHGIPFTLYVQGDHPVCRQYSSDGTFVTGAMRHPLDADVQVSVTHFSEFRKLFFGAGGVHAMPGTLEPVDGDGFPDMRRRDLFYFDEAQGYTMEEFGSFVRLVEFLFAEDMDVLIGATTLPEACLEELSFIESLTIPDALYQPPRSMRFETVGIGEKLDRAEDIVRHAYHQNSRVIVALDNIEDLQAITARCSSLYPQNVFCYHSALPIDERLMVYAQLRELEKEGEGYLLIIEGLGLENADLDASVLITSVCAPEALLRRAGRCNRRGDLAKGQIVVIDDGSYSGRPLPHARHLAYVSQLKSYSEERDFIPEPWKRFIV